MQFLKYLFFIAFLFISATIKAEYFVIKDYDIVLELFEDRTLQVTETIVVEFSEPRHGIFRNIPDRYEYPENAIRVAPHRGAEFPVRIYDVKVEGHNFETIAESWQTVIKIGDADRYVDGQQTYKISYKVDPAILLYEEHCEFYWNMIGTRWGTEIEAVSYELVLPKRLDLKPGEDLYIYTGARGQQGQNATVNYENRLIYGETTEWLKPNEGVTIAVKFPATYFERPTEFDENFWTYGGFGIFGIVGGFIYFLFNLIGKGKSITEMVRYYPPEGILPSEAGYLIDNKNNKRDLMAMIPYFGQQKWLRLEHTRTNSLKFVKLQDLPSDRPMFEQTFFNGIFEDGKEEVLLSSLRDKFYKTLGSASSKLDNHIKEKKYYNNKVQRNQILVGFMGVLMIVFGFFFGMLFNSVWVGLLFVALSIFLFATMSKWKRKTDEGHRLYEELYGFRMFVDKAEKDKLRFLLDENPLYFESTLPFAVAFGMVKDWGKQFDELLTQPPSWYYPYYGYDPHRHHYTNDYTPSDFTNNFDNDIQQIQQVFSSSPAPEGGSGGGGSSSGGGFSGGGMGGGGGGSW